MIFKFFDFFKNFFITAKNGKVEFWDSDNSTNFKHQWLESYNCKLYQPAYH